MTLRKDQLVDAAMDRVLKEMHDSGRMRITSNPASNLRDGIIAGMFDLGFDIVFDGFTTPDEESSQEEWSEFLEWQRSLGAAN